MESTIFQQLTRLESLILSIGKDALTLEEVAVFTGLSKSYLYKLTSTNQIPFYKRNGKNIYFSKQEIENWMLQNRVKPTEEIEGEAATYVTLKNK
jgi:excisionase family DNA binding protein